MKYHFIIGLFVLLPSFLMAQSSASIKRKADKLFDKKDYKAALSFYEQIKEKYVKDTDLKYNIGVCHYHLYQMVDCISYLTFYAKNDNKPTPKVHYYLAKAYHLQHAFKDAAKYYKNYIRSLDEDDPQRDWYKNLIIQCTNGPKVEQMNSNAIVATLGDQINSSYDDYRVCFNPQISNTVFFSSNRADVTGGKLNYKNESDEENGYYRSDIYESKLVQGNWAAANHLSSRYNTSLSEDIISFFDNGYQMLFLKGFADGHQEIVKENFDEDSIEVILPFAIEASSNHWDGDHFFVSDNIIIFSSDRPGGYGGRDLYYAIQSPDGIWQSAINMGHEINTEQDEVSPFLCNDGRTLFFSSNQKMSMGGYDVYSAVFNDSLRLWTKIKNAGTPINSPADDKDFLITADGSKAYFSSGRLGGLGGLDLYSAYFRSAKTSQLSTGKQSFIDVLQAEPIITQVPNQSTIDKITPNTSTNNSSENKKIYNIAPIYYDAQTGAIEGSRNTIRALTRLLVRHPEVTIVLSGHADNTGNNNSDLYLTVKQAEDLAKNLVKEGVNSEQIWIRGCGQNYPIATNENFDGTPNLIGNKMNRRINVDVFNLKPLKNVVQVNIIEPEVSSVMQNKAYTRYKNTVKGLSYKVQFTETASLLNHAILNELPHAITEKHPNDINVKYMIGLENSFVAIKRILDKCKQSGFTNAQIIPYINGVRISEEDAQVLFKDYPDLSNFLEFLSN